MKCAAITAAVLVIVLGGGQVASATEIRVDIGSQWLAGGVNTLGVANGSLSDLTDFTTQLPTVIDLTTSGWDGPWGMSNFWTEGTTDWVSDPIGDDCFYALGGLASATFSSLPGQSYRVEVLSSMAATNYMMNIYIGAEYADGNYQNVPGVNGQSFSAKYDGRDAANWLIWSDVTPVNGEIQINFSTSVAYDAALNGLRLTEIPEPATMSLLAIGGLALLRRRRK